MAATDKPSLNTLISAAHALFGVLPAPALAQTAQDQSAILLRYFDYRDWQRTRSG